MCSTSPRHIRCTDKRRSPGSQRVRIVGNCIARTTLPSHHPRLPFLMPQHSRRCESNRRRHMQKQAKHAESLRSTRGSVHAYEPILYPAVFPKSMTSTTRPQGHPVCPRVSSTEYSRKTSPRLVLQNPTPPASSLPSGQQTHRSTPSKSCHLGIARGSLPPAPAPAQSSGHFGSIPPWH